VSSDGWTDEEIMIYIHNGMFFSHTKDEILSPSTAWMEPKTIMLSEISQARKDKHSMISPVES
jgi:hypothetical protein